MLPVRARIPGPQFIIGDHHVHLFADCNIAQIVLFEILPIAAEKGDRQLVPFGLVDPTRQATRLDEGDVPLCVAASVACLCVSLPTQISRAAARARRRLAGDVEQQLVADREIGELQSACRLSRRGFRSVTSSSFCRDPVVFSAMLCLVVSSLPSRSFISSSR